ncbi:hypothetical protein LG634_07260 [Streptomyces bambusae]|uniref:hypothetical protein n=1 Tax=Streptomyces bambusae TaxID=1550616 RepID=UPI001CFED3B2|nr:hypothetical protein [Streptomyces bambusae]MCB5164630.1 hypothetical protein [Streptomyces bambusae]
MSEFIAGAMQPFAQGGQAATSLASLVLPTAGNVKLRAEVRKDDFGRGAVVSRHPTLKATDLFKIRFTYSKNRSALVTTNVFEAMGRAAQFAYAEAEKTYHKKKYSEDDVIRAADKHAIEQKFELKTRLVIPLELTLDLTPYIRINQAEYEEYKIRLAGASQRGEDLAAYNGPTLSHYLAIGSIDLHLGAHVNLENKNDEPFEMFADIIPDDHTKDRTGRYIRVIIQVRDLGFRGIGKIEESYDFKFLVKSDFTWELVDEEPPSNASNRLKEVFANNKAQREAHFSFGDDAYFPKEGSQAVQEARKKKVDMPATANRFTMDPDLTADNVTPEILDGLLEQVYVLALHNDKDSALQALHAITLKNLVPYPVVGLGRLLKSKGLKNVPTSFFADGVTALEIITWIARSGTSDRIGKEALELALVVGGATGAKKSTAKKADERLRKLLTDEFGDQQGEKILFMVQEANAQLGIIVNSGGVTRLADLFKLIAATYKKQGPPSTTSLKPETVDAVTMGQISKLLTRNDHGGAYGILQDYVARSGTYTELGPALLHLAHAAKLFDEEQTVLATRILTDITSPDKTRVLDGFGYIAMVMSQQNADQ